MADGTKASKWFVRGEGLVSDSSPVMIFGLGETDPVSVSVRYLDGRVVESRRGVQDGVVRFGGV